MQNCKQWYILAGTEDGEIFLHEFSPEVTLTKGQILPADSGLVVTMDTKQPVKVLVKCSELQNALVNALEALDGFTGGNSTLLTLTEIIREAREETTEPSNAS